MGCLVFYGLEIAPDRPTAKLKSFAPEYPAIALREVLVNAVAHADYSLSGMRIRVAIYADRLEVENPGMLPFGMTLDDFRAGVSRIRNRVIARVLRELGLVEEWGTGYLRVIEACREGGHPAPEWEEHGACLRAVFRPHPEAESAGDATANVPVDVPANVPVNVPVNARQEWLLEQLARGQRIKSADLATELAVSEKTARRDIAGLRELGLIEFVGAPKTGHYRLVEGAFDVAVDVPVTVPANVPVNARQRWLLEQLARGQRTKTADLAARFAVSEKTARRDIADLRELGLIEFVGAPKTGHYRLRE